MVRGVIFECPLQIVCCQLKKVYSAYALYVDIASMSLSTVNPRIRGGLIRGGGQFEDLRYTEKAFIFRYSAVRKQFGPTSSEEIPVIEYQMQVELGCINISCL